MERSPTEVSVTRMEGPASASSDAFGAIAIEVELVTAGHVSCLHSDFSGTSN